MIRTVAALFIMVVSTQVFATDKMKKVATPTRSKSSFAFEKGGNSDFATIDAWGELGQDTFTRSSSDESSMSLQGLGFGGGAHYRLKAGQNGVGLLGGGVHYSTVSASTLGITLSYTLITVRPDLAFLYFPTKKFGIGGFLAMDLLLLSGSASAKYEDVSVTKSVSSISQTIFGPRGLFELSPHLFIGAQYGIGSGSIKVDTSVSFKSNTLALLVVKNFGAK